MPCQGVIFQQLSNAVMHLVNGVDFKGISMELAAFVLDEGIALLVDVLVAVLSHVGEVP